MTFPNLEKLPNLAQTIKQEVMSGLQRIRQKSEQKGIELGILQGMQERTIAIAK